MPVTFFKGPLVAPLRHLKVTGGATLWRSVVQFPLFLTHYGNQRVRSEKSKQIFMTPDQAWKMKPVKAAQEDKSALALSWKSEKMLSPPWNLSWSHLIQANHHFLQTPNCALLFYAFLVGPSQFPSLLTVCVIPVFSSGRAGAECPSPLCGLP